MSTRDDNHAAHDWTPPAFHERDLSKPAEQQGLFHKFDVRRVDGSDQLGGKHYGCRYYVLDLTHDQHAPAALRAYADSCATTHPELSADLRAEYGRTPAVDVVGQDAAVAAIQFALEDEDGLDFLSYWNEGEFDVIRRNWENVPEAVFIGTDPLHPATRVAAPSAGEVLFRNDGLEPDWEAHGKAEDDAIDAARLAKLLELCTEAKTRFGRKGDLQAVTMTFKTSVRTSVGYRDQLRKLIDDMTPTFDVPADRTTAKGPGAQGGAA